MQEDVNEGTVASSSRNIQKKQTAAGVKKKRKVKKQQTVKMRVTLSATAQLSDVSPEEGPLETETTAIIPPEEQIVICNIPDADPRTSSTFLEKPI